ncbi:MAG: RNA-directed DNA polymerase [Verrucomicrobiota bacterium]
MRRVGSLFDSIFEFENLRLAFAKAARGKRHQEVVRKFSSGLDSELKRMRTLALGGVLAVGNYHRFVIHDPKRRVIHACAFPERVLHHAIMNRCECVFDRSMIFDTYACRKGKGRLAGLERTRGFARRGGFFLKLDIRKFFESISHETLKGQLGRLFKDEALLALFGRMIDSYEVEVGRGLPIGALTSQFFANCYLNSLDRFAKESLKAKRYLRYMDDFALWNESRDLLKDWKLQIESFLENRLSLSLNDAWRLEACPEGMSFLGTRIFSAASLVARRGRLRFAARLRVYENAFCQGRLGEADLQRRVSALIAATDMAGDARWRSIALSMGEVCDA